ncbi:MAG: DUF86 domain-containing protein [Candidatus Hydrogenedentes bacterium]|nr:DUF86 domain-containing protein [Candidatus Hydrogenedentota bacterium]
MVSSADRNRLIHIRAALEEATGYAAGMTLEALRKDRPGQHLLMRNLEIMGEAAARLSPDFREAHPEFPWRNMIAMRNRLIHAYFDVNLAIVLETVQQALPPLKDEFRKLLNRER